MNNPLISIWIQYDTTYANRFAHAVMQLMGILARSGAIQQSRFLDVHGVRSKGAQSNLRLDTRLTRAGCESAIRDIDTSQFSLARVSCNQRGVRNTFENEVWSCSYLDGRHYASERDEICVCIRADILSEDSATQTMVDIIGALTHDTEIVSGVCDVSSWSSTLGGQYYTRGILHGLPRFMAVRQGMWNDGGSTVEWARDVGWITILGREILTNIEELDDICEQYRTRDNALSSVRRQHIYRNDNAIMFVSHHNLMRYYEDCLGGCSELDGWLAFQLGRQNVLM